MPDFFINGLAEAHFSLTDTDIITSQTARNILIIFGMEIDVDKI